MKRALRCSWKLFLIASELAPYTPRECFGKLSTEEIKESVQKIARALKLLLDLRHDVGHQFKLVDVFWRTACGFTPLSARELHKKAEEKDEFLKLKKKFEESNTALKTLGKLPWLTISQKRKAQRLPNS